MRGASITIGVLASCSLVAQDWALLNPAYRYNYSLGGTDTITNQVFVERLDTLGPDSVVYHLNGVVSPAPTSVQCGWGQQVYRLHAPQFIGSHAMRSGADWFLIGEDNLLIRTAALPGQIWTSPGGIQGGLQFAVQSSVLGAPDSLKWFAYDNGVTMILSKAHGLRWIARSGTEHHLVGVQGAMELGLRYPTQRDFFDYQPGDALEYRGTTSWTDGLCWNTSNHKVRYDILQRTDGPTSTSYQVQRITNSQWSSTPVIWSGGLCTSGQWVHTSVILVIVEQDSWTADNPFGNAALNRLWPGAFASPDPNNWPFESHMDFHSGLCWRSRLLSDGRYVLDTEPFGMQSTIYEPGPGMGTCVDDSLGLINDMQTVRFVQGIGRTMMSFFTFEHDGNDSLYAYNIGGDQVGTFTPLDVIMRVAGAEQTPITIAPNPSNDQCMVSHARLGSRLSLSDAAGRVVLMQRLASANETIDVQHLAPGIYLLSVDGVAQQRLVIAR